jgi:hypothetical protein
MDCVLYVGAESLNAGKFEMNFMFCKLRHFPVIMHLTDTILLVLSAAQYEYRTAQNCIVFWM